MIDEKAIVNGIVGLHATGGSTNHTIHLVAIARAAGIAVTWDDFADLSEVVPLLARIYPNGIADVNHFQAAGGMGFLIARAARRRPAARGRAHRLGQRPVGLSRRGEARRRRQVRWRAGAASSRRPRCAAPGARAFPARPAV